MWIERWDVFHHYNKIIEPRHDKTNKVSVHPAKTQISLGWSESSLSAWRKLGSLATHWAQANTLIRLGGCPCWSESSLGAQSLCWFCHVAAHINDLCSFEKVRLEHKFFFIVPKMARKRTLPANVLKTPLPGQIITSHYVCCCACYWWIRPGMHKAVY